VAFQRFSRPVRPKDHLVVLVPQIEQERFAPVRSTGDRLQHVYLTSISTAFAEVILGLAGEHQRFSNFNSTDLRPLVERELAGQREWEDIEQRHILEAEIPTTTRHAPVQARIGQGLFKERVSRFEKACRLTFVENPSREAPYPSRHWHVALFLTADCLSV
jgi:hypothetical protein